MRPRKNKEVSEKTLLIPRMEQDLLSETPGFLRIITHPGIMEFFEVTP